MLLPVGKVLHRNLSTYYTRSRMLVKDLEEMRFSGYIKVSYWEYDGYIFFDTGKIIQIFAFRDTKMIDGHKALLSIIENLGDKEGMINVNALESDILAVVSALHTRKMTQSFEKITREGLQNQIDKILTAGDSGYLSFEFGQNQGEGAIYFSHGSIISAVLQSESGRTVTETKTSHLFQRFFNLVESIKTSMKMYNCDLIAAYEKSPEVDRWVKFYDFMYLLGKLHRHITNLLTNYCAPQELNRILMKNTISLRTDYGFPSIIYEKDWFHNFDSNNIIQMKKFYIELINVLLLNLENSYPIDRKSLKISIIPFQKHFQQDLINIGFDKEIESLFER